MPDKYLKENNGVLEEVEALDASTGAGDAGKIPALDAAGRLDQSMMPTGIGADTATIQASENLSAGDFVNVHDNTGARVRKADGTSAGKPAHGFVLEAVTLGQSATVYFEGTNTQIAGATAGPVYLSASTPGGFQAAAPTGTGNVVQRIGVATAATAINFEPGPAITKA